MASVIVREVLSFTTIAIFNKEGLNRNVLQTVIADVLTKQGQTMGALIVKDRTVIELVCLKERKVAIISVALLFLFLCRGLGLGVS